MPTVICKFIYFADEKEIFKRIPLRNKKNPINGNNIYINEPLPECEAQIKAEATKRILHNNNTQLHCFRARRKQRTKTSIRTGERNRRLRQSYNH